MNITENARTVLEKRYLIRDAQGKALETVPQLFQRVASAIAQADRNYDPQADVEKTAQEFYDTMTDLRFLPNSPTLMNAGRELGQLSACFTASKISSMLSPTGRTKQAES